MDGEELWVDTLKFYKRRLDNNTCLGRQLGIFFKGEDGLDLGAMMVEFFNLAIEKGIKRLFEGDPLNLVPVKDATKLLLFRIVRTMFVHVVFQGGPVDMFPFLAPSIAAFLAGEGKEAVTVHLYNHHIPMNAATECLHLLLESLENWKTDFDVQKLLYGEMQTNHFGK